MKPNKCSICKRDFDEDEEGGVSGVFGTFIPVAFCPECLSCVFDMVEQLTDTGDINETA